MRVFITTIIFLSYIANTLAIGAETNPRLLSVKVIPSKSMKENGISKLTVNVLDGQNVIFNIIDVREDSSYFSISPVDKESLFLEKESKASYSCSILTVDNKEMLINMDFLKSNFSGNTFLMPTAVTIKPKEVTLPISVSNVVVKKYIFQTIEGEHLVLEMKWLKE